MKRIFIQACILLAAFAITSCGGNSGSSNGKKFNPTERTSSLSDEERAEALARKRASLGINLDTLLYGHGVKFGVLRPRLLGEDITEDISDRIAVKLLEIASQNGISGTGNYGIVFGTEITQTGRAATGSAPQKMTVNYTLTFKVMNTATGDVYGTTTQDILGVGNSFIEANQNAVREIKNTPALQKMLATASERIIKWYNENLQTVKNQVEKAEGEGDYALALAILTSIPEQSTAYKYVAEKQDQLLKGMLHKQAADMLAEMEAAAASSGDDFNPAIGAFLKLIPTDCPEHKTAQSIYAEYEKKCNARRADLEAKAERDEQAARDLERFKLMQEHETELAEIEAEKMKVKYKAQAAAAKANSGGSNRGLFGSMGFAIGGTFERLFKVADVAGAALTDKMGLEKYVEKVEDDF